MPRLGAKVPAARRALARYGSGPSGPAMSAAQGDAKGQYHLGVCYQNGEGVSQDYKEAVTWIRKAADQREASAQFDLGYCYEIGEGVVQDYTEATKWYRKAADQGWAFAQGTLGICCAFGCGVRENATDAVAFGEPVINLLAAGGERERPLDRHRGKRLG